MSKAGDLYGQSLYDLAAEENLTDDILGEMEQVKGIFKENPDYVTLLSEPSVPKKERLQLVDESLGESLTPYHLNFIKILIEKGLLREYSACYKRFRKTYNETHGIADALVTTAVTLSDAQLDHGRRGGRHYQEADGGRQSPGADRPDPPDSAAGFRI